MAKKQSAKKSPRRKLGAHSDPTVGEAHGAIAQGRAAASAEGTGVAVAVVRGVPDLEVEVAPETSLSHEGKSYGAGDRLVLSGADAIALIQSGHVLPAGGQ